ncbi:MAG: alpha/beta hydrolase [Microbacterium sp. 71-36]|mgnify:CR=1 FL=1|uniref:alpha/beta fold hydrolase n=1 Tax=unclassified Microbacterium TaxID=2609290 RepID=UPI00086A020D|nr:MULTISPECIES: alpha/beta hydrolase [unclassified Microbacterium]MBN9210561.1 alpha/beta hydrolase [Microbacterium sp.]ODT40613.1 MAG: hydrolase [Microbacterium sp. SCN 71-17]OJV76192.1 MAG: alpha/beta hydrolase [Microbacterium sp. 71-36]
MPETDEFSFLPAQAAAAGVEVPRVERVGLTLPDGRTLSGLRWGEEPPRVTLLHGAGLNAHTWDTTLLHLGVPALAVDLAGHGDSSWRDDAAYVGRVLAPDVAAALEAWTDRPQVLVGHSLGGLTAAAVAASRPELVERVVIIDITPGIDPSGGPAQLRAFFAGPTDWATRDELVDKALAFGLGGARSAAERGVFLNTRVRPDGRVEWKHHFAHLAAAAAAAGADTSTPDAVRAVLASTGWDDIAAVRAPILFVRADRGFVTAADADELVRQAADARVRVVPTAHNVQEEDPAGLAALLRETLTAV